MPDGDDTRIGYIPSMAGVWKCTLGGLAEQLGLLTTINSYTTDWL